MDRKKEEHSILDASFDIEHQKEETIADILMGRPSSSDESPTKKKKRPWRSDKEECPNCGTLFVSGCVCPGCGLHDEEMPWSKH